MLGKLLCFLNIHKMKPALADMRQRRQSLEYPYNLAKSMRRKTKYTDDCARCGKKVGFIF